MADETTTNEENAGAEGAEQTPAYSFEMNTPEETVESQDIPEPVAEVETVAETAETEEAEEEEDTYDLIDEDDYQELDEDLAIQYLAGSKGMTVDEFKDSLTPKEQKKYAPELEKFQEFIEKTGNTDFNDFKATQKDWDAETPENTLKEYIKAKNPELSKKELDFLYDEKYSVEDLDEEDDENLILKKGINTKTDLREAKAFLESRKAEYMADRGSDAHIPEDYREAKKTLDNQAKQQEDNKVVYQKERADYLSHIESTYTDDSKGFEIEFGNEEAGFEKAYIKPDDMKAEREYVSDIDNFNKQFYDENGTLKDPKGFTDALIKARNYERDMKIAWGLGYAKKVELDDRKSKNIQPDNVGNSAPEQSGGYKFSVG